MNHKFLRKKDIFKKGLIAETDNDKGAYQLLPLLSVLTLAAYTVTMLTNSYHCHQWIEKQVPFFQSRWPITNFEWFENIDQP